MKSVQLVPIAVEDQEPFTAMAIQYFRALNPKFVPQEDWKQNYFSRIQKNSNMHLEWIQKDGNHAGYVLYGIEDHRFLPRKTGAIYDLYIEPAFRRDGLAREALALAIQTLRALLPSHIQLEAMASNEGGAALLKSLGFHKVTERFVLPGEGH